MIYKDTAGLEMLENIRTGNFKLGLGIDCDLDNHVRYKQTQFTVIAGHANTGKTTAILYYFLALAVRHNLKFIIFSSENDVWSIKDDLITFKVGKRIKGMDKEELLKENKWVAKHFKFLDGEAFFSKTKRLMNFRDIFKATDDAFNLKGFNPNALVIDPYNSLGRADDIKGNTHEYDYQVMAEFRIWCKQQNKALYLLAHGNTEALRKVYPRSHEFEGHTIPLQSADIEGGGKFVNRCDCFIVIHRMTGHDELWNQTEWRVMKNKVNKTGGKPTFKNNPVIMELNDECTKFICYTRQTDRETQPINIIDPLSIKKPLTFESKLKPNVNFEIVNEF
jgi:hypothetical protein